MAKINFTLEELKVFHNTDTIYCSFCHLPITNLNTHSNCLNSLSSSLTYLISNMKCFICQANPPLQKEINALEIKHDGGAEEYPQKLLMYICPMCNATQNFIEALLENTKISLKA